MSSRALSASLLRDKGKSRDLQLNQKLKKNADGTVDVYFAPGHPLARNRIGFLTRDRKPFFVMFRIYGPQKGAAGKSWVLRC